jgi:class III poly(R)-hydroxyalkanoic acid synthase PhaE subunit
MHTECRLLQSDPWQQWQAFAAQFAKGASAPRSAHGPAAASSFTPFTDVAERFAGAARAYFDAAHASVPAPADAARIFSDSLREMFADFQPWNMGVGAGTGHGSVPPGFAADSPALGATREHQQRWQHIADAWRRLEEAQRRLQRIGSDALREAAAAFTSRLAASPPTESPEALHKLYGSWIDCAEDAYGRAAHSEPFCDALAECVNASSEWRRELQASIEHSAKLLDQPTRSEINTLTQRVKSLEEDVRALHQVRKPKPKAKAAARKTRPARRRAKP